LFPRIKLKAIRKEIWLEDFHLRSTKKLDVYRAIHVNGRGSKVITIESINVWWKAWYTIQVVSKDTLLISKMAASAVTMGKWVSKNLEKQQGKQQPL
jgi:hypothetical protein